MLIDDDSMTNFLNKRLIEKLEITDTIAVWQYAEDALEHLKNVSISELPDIILVDLNMPRMNGWEFLGCYQKLHLKIRKNISIYILSTSNNPDDLENAKKYSELKGFITKPLTKETLYSLVPLYQKKTSIQS